MCLESGGVLESQSQIEVSRTEGPDKQNLSNIFELEQLKVSGLIRKILQLHIPVLHFNMYHPY